MSLFLSATHNPYCDLPQYFAVDVSFRTRRPRVLPPYLNLYRTLEGTIWTMLLLAVAGTTAALLLAAAAGHPKAPKKPSNSLSEVLLLPWGILMAENHFLWFHSRGGASYKGGTFLRYVWLFATVLLSAAYQSNLKVTAEADGIYFGRGMKAALLYSGLAHKDLPRRNG